MKVRRLELPAQGHYNEPTAPELERMQHHRGERIARQYGFRYDPADPCPITLFEQPAWTQRQLERHDRELFEKMTGKPDEHSTPSDVVTWAIGTGVDDPDSDDPETWTDEQRDFFVTLCRSVTNTADKAEKAANDELDRIGTEDLIESVRQIRQPGRPRKDAQVTGTAPSTVDIVVAEFNKTPDAKTSEIARRLQVSATTVSNAKKAHAVACLRAGKHIPRWAVSSTKPKAYSRSIIAHMTREIEKNTAPDDGGNDDENGGDNG